MSETVLNNILLAPGGSPDSLRMLLKRLKTPFVSGQKVGIKLHWGEWGNHYFLPPLRAKNQAKLYFFYPELYTGKCTRCGECISVCPTGAARFNGSEYPSYDREICIGCAQCIALCPEAALRILWGKDHEAFQEKLVETAAALWRRLRGRTTVINALLNITSDCDCLTGENPVIAPDFGFVGGYHPVEVDMKSLELIGAAPFEKAHPGISWRRQFTYAEEIGFFRGE